MENHPHPEKFLVMARKPAKQREKEFVEHLEHCPHCKEQFLQVEKLAGQEQADLLCEEFSRVLATCDRKIEISEIRRDGSAYQGVFQVSIKGEKPDV